MIIKRFNESSKVDKLGILEDIFRSLEDEYQVEIKSEEFKVRDRQSACNGRRLQNNEYPNVMDLIRNTIDKKENEIMSSKYISSLISNGDYHKQMRSNKTEEDYDMIMKYFHSTFYKICISIQFNTNNHYDKAKSLFKEYDNLIEIANSYDLVNVYEFGKEWTSQKTIIIFN
jgi:hypothetical protein